MNQVVYNTSRGRILEMTNPTFFKNMSRLAIHFDPILIFFAPFYWFFPSPTILLIIQVIIVAFGALVIYKLSFLILKKRTISFLFFLLYLLNYQIARSLLFDFHPVVLAIPFLLSAFYFYHLKKLKLYYFFIFLSLLTKEHIGLFLVFLGLFYFFVFKDKKNGSFTFIIGFLFFITINFLVIPHFRQESHFALSYYNDLRNKETIFNLLTKDKIRYLARIYSPFLYSFFNPVIIISFPELMINFLSNNSNMRAIYFHYQSLILAGLFYGLILGYRSFEIFFKKNRLSKKFFFSLFLIFNLYYFYLYYPLPYFVKEKINFLEISDQTKKIIYFWQRNLNNEKIKVSTTPKLAPFFTNRRFYLNFLFDYAFYSLGYTDEEIFRMNKENYRMVDYIIVYQKEIGDLSKENATTKLYNNLLKDNDFKLIFNEAEIQVFKKIK